MTTLGLGATVRAGRERAGLSLPEISAATKIRAGLLAAIERDEFTGCGGDFYARGHLRAIARVANLDAPNLLAEFALHHAQDRIVPAEPRPAARAVPSLLARRRLFRQIRPGT